MKRIIIEYFEIIGYTVLGITFGLCFFLIFINFYHYQDVNHEYVKQNTDFEVENELKNKLMQIKNNSIVDVNTYHGKEDTYSIMSVSTRLNTCVDRINNEEFDKLIAKKNISMKDLYEIQQFYQTNISNDCLIKQIYELSDSSNSRINLSTLPLISPFIKDNTNILIKKTDYIQKILKSNSNYSFTSEASRVDIYDSVKDSYYELLNDYKAAIDYLYNISVWFQGVIRN